MGDKYEGDVATDPLFVKELLAAVDELVQKKLGPEAMQKALFEKGYTLTIRQVMSLSRAVRK